MNKIFVLDTNVLLYDPQAIMEFVNAHVVIPVTVVEELDKMKRLPGELGKNARAVFRFLDAAPKMGKGNLHDGVKMQNGTVIRIQLEIPLDRKSPLLLNPNDNKIVLTAYQLTSKSNRVVFVSKDFSARIKAEALGLETQDYEKLKFSYKTIYRGVRKLDYPKKEIDLFYKDAALAPPVKDPKPNEYFVLTSPERSSALAKYNPQKGALEPLLKEVNLWGVHPRNVEQKCCVDALLRDDIRLVTLMGPAGTGKTLLALACGLHKVFDENRYNRILISRPVVPLGRDIGYLPGTKEEKLFTWMQPIYDNLDFLCESSGREPNETVRWVLDSKKIEMEAVTYIRGRSLPKMYLIVDEAQNLTPHEIKTIISRAGEDTKVVLTGDPTQIDNPYLDENSNGLTYVVGKFQDLKIFGQVFLEKTERSELAALATEVM